MTSTIEKLSIVDTDYRYDNTPPNMNTLLNFINHIHGDINGNWEKCFFWKGQINRKKTKHGEQEIPIFHVNHKTMRVKHLSLCWLGDMTLTRYSRIHSKCGNVKCINPRHLEVKSPKYKKDRTRKRKINKKEKVPNTDTKKRKRKRKRKTTQKSIIIPKNGDDINAILYDLNHGDDDNDDDDDDNNKRKKLKLYHEKEDIIIDDRSSGNSIIGINECIKKVCS